MLSPVQQAVARSQVLCQDLLQLVNKYIGRGLTEIHLKEYIDSYYVKGLGRVNLVGGNLEIQETGKKPYNVKRPEGFLANEPLGYHNRTLYFDQVDRQTYSIVAFNLDEKQWHSYPVTNRALDYNLLLTMENGVLVILSDKPFETDCQLPHQVIVVKQSLAEADDLQVMGSYLMYHDWANHSAEKCRVCDRKGQLVHSFDVSGWQKFVDEDDQLLYLVNDDTLFIYDSVSLEHFRSLPLPNGDEVTFDQDDQGQLVLID